VVPGVAQSARRYPPGSLVAGEFQAAERLVEAAERLSGQPTSMQLRYLQTLTEIAGEKSSTIVFPLPVNVMDSLQQLLGAAPAAGTQDEPAA